MAIFVGSLQIRIDMPQFTHLHVHTQYSILDGGHSNIQTTQVYARVTPKKLFEDMDRLIEATGDLKLVL